MVKESIKLSIVIPTRNRIEYLIKLLDSIKNQNFDLKSIEIIIISDSDLDIQKLEEERIKEYKKVFGRLVYVRNKKRMFLGYNQYLGIKLSNGEYIMLIDDDEELIDKNFLKKFIEEYEEIKKKIKADLLFLIPVVIDKNNLIYNPPIEIKSGPYRHFYFFVKLIKHIFGIKWFNIPKIHIKNIEVYRNINKRFRRLKITIFADSLYLPFITDKKFIIFYKLFRFHHTETFSVFYYSKIKRMKVVCYRTLNLVCKHHIDIFDKKRTMKTRDPLIFYNYIYSEIFYNLKFVKRFMYVIYFILTRTYLTYRIGNKKIRATFIKAVKNAIRDFIIPKWQK